VPSRSVQLHGRHFLAKAAIDIERATADLHGQLAGRPGKQISVKEVLDPPDLELTVGA